VLAAGGVLLGAAVLQSLLIRVPGPAANNPHAITVDTKPPAASPKPWDEPAPIVEVAPPEPFDAAPTGAVPDAPKSADHAIDPEGPPSPRDAANTPSDPALTKPESAGAKPPKAPDKPAAIEPKVETPPADVKPAPKPEPTQVATPSPESAPTRASAATLPAESKPMPAPEPAKVADAPAQALEPVSAHPVPEAKSVEEARVETLPEEPASEADPDAAEVATSGPSEPEPESNKSAARTEPKTKVTPVEVRQSKPAPQRALKTNSGEAKAAPKSVSIEKPSQTGAVEAPGKLFGKPMALGFGRKPAPAASKVNSGRYAASVRAAIGRHRPRVGGGGSATVAFSIGPAGGVQAVQIVRSSGRPAADQAAIATVRAAAPFAPPPAGAKNSFSIQIYFR
jgi:protein TonB